VDSFNESTLFALKIWLVFPIRGWNPRRKIVALRLSCECGCITVQDNRI